MIMVWFMVVILGPWLFLEHILHKLLIRDNLKEKLHAQSTFSKFSFEMKIFVFNTPIYPSIYKHQEDLLLKLKLFARELKLLEHYILS
jgi:hypothetical protein